MTRTRTFKILNLDSKFLTNSLLQFESTSKDNKSNHSPLKEREKFKGQNKRKLTLKRNCRAVGRAVGAPGSEKRRHLGSGGDEREIERLGMRVKILMK